MSLQATILTISSTDEGMEVEATILRDGVSLGDVTVVSPDIAGVPKLLRRAAATLGSIQPGSTIDLS